MGTISMIKSFEKYFEYFEREKQFKISKETMKWVHNRLVFNKSNNLNNKIKDELSIFNENDYSILYRGLSWRQEDFKVWKPYLGNEFPFEKGNTLRLVNSDISSWTTSFESTKDFTTGQGSRGPYWVILETRNIYKKEVLLDVGNYLNKMKTDLHVFSYQKEVLLNPGRYECEVIYSGKRNEEIKHLW